MPRMIALDPESSVSIHQPYRRFNPGQGNGNELTHLQLVAAVQGGEMDFLEAAARYHEHNDLVNDESSLVAAELGGSDSENAFISTLADATFDFSGENSDLDVPYTFSREGLRRTTPHERNYIDPVLLKHKATGASAEEAELKLAQTGTAEGLTFARLLRIDEEDFFNAQRSNYIPAQLNALRAGLAELRKSAAAALLQTGEFGVATSMWDTVNDNGAAPLTNSNLGEAYSSLRSIQSSEGAHLDLTPDVLLVHPVLRVPAEQIVRQLPQLDLTIVDDPRIGTVRHPVSGEMLTSTGGTGTWYLLDSSKAVELSWINGMPQVVSGQTQGEQGRHERTWAMLAQILVATGDRRAIIRNHP